MDEFAAPLTKIWKKKGVFLALIAVLLVPLIYAAIILTASWGPYDNLSNLPVAVVNNDKGAMSGNEAINVGEDLVADLKSNTLLGWDFVSKAEAEKGIKNSKYYMIIEIPENFSHDVTTVLSENPTVPELIYTRNEGMHFMAAQVTNNAVERIRTQLAEKITETYVKNMFAQLEQVASGFKDGADGSSKLRDGSVSLHEGTEQILHSLQSKSADINKLAAGSKELKSGTGTLLQSLEAKSSDITKLATGTKDLAAGLAQFSTHSTSLQAGSTQVLDGLRQSQAGSTQLSQALALLAPGSQQVADGVTAVKSGADQLATASTQVAQGLAQLAQHPQLGAILSNSPEFQALLQGSKLVSEGLDKLATDSVALQAGAGQVAEGLAQASPGAQALNEGIGRLVAGQAQIADGAKQLAAGANQLGTGATTIADGNTSLNSAWSTLTTSVATIDNGMQSVTDGNQSVNDGWTALTDGMVQLDSGISQIKDGSEALATGLSSGAEQMGSLQVKDENISQFSSSVGLDGTTINGFPLYRYANAPYVLSLALFVGAFALILLFNVRKPEDCTISTGKWYVSAFVKLAGFSAIQAVLMSTFALFFIKLSAAHSVLLLLFSIVASITFLALIFFLVVLAGTIGRFIALAFIVLQLSTTGSSLPVEMLPENLRVLSNFLPMRYSIDSFRALISLDNTSAAWSSLTMLAIFLVVAAALTAVVAVIHGRKSDSHIATEA